MIISLVSWLPYLGLIIGLLIKTTAVGAAAVALVNSRRG